MTETISNLKNHACPSCDDQLRVNEDDMLSQAAQLLGKEESVKRIKEAIAKLS